MSDDLSTLLADRGRYPGVGVEAGRAVRDGIALYRDPYGSFRYVLYDAGEPVGGLQVMSSDGKHAVIANVYVVPSRRRHGVASALLERARRDFKSVRHADDQHLSEAGRAFAQAVPNAMDPAVAERVLRAAETVGADKHGLNTKTATFVVQEWLRARGLEEDRWGNFIDPKAPDDRWHFKDRVVNRQTKLHGEWRNRASNPLLEAADNLITKAADALGRAELLEAARARKGQRGAAREKRATKAERQALEDRARQLATKAVAAQYRPEVLQALLGKLSVERQRELGEEQQQHYERILQLLETGAELTEDGIVTVDYPPVLPLKMKLRYVWTVNVDAVPYTIMVDHKAGAARIVIGSVGMGSVYADPVTHQALAQDWIAEGDAIGIGQVRIQDGAVEAALFMLVSHTKQRGAGSRILSLWCRMMIGYDVETWLAEAVGTEGEAFLRALERRGAIKLEGRRGSYWLVRCL